LSDGNGSSALTGDGEGWYLYGVVAAGPTPVELERLTGVDPRHEVAVLAEGELAGVTSRVSLEEFDEAALPERLGDSAWLEEKIRAHEGVLEGVLASAPVIPCRFCTVYRSEGDLRLFLADRGSALREALGRVAGKVELGVKAFLDPERATVREPEESGEAGAGRAYLERRRADQRAREELAQLKQETAVELHDCLVGAADDGVELALQKPELSGRDEDMVFNGAYLVSDRVRFERELERLRVEHAELALELTGPWPPYNFVPAELGES
jgi:gas vesicle protein GvpL/GvpF